MKTCPNCGQPALDWHRFCMRCGMDISAVAPSAAPPQYANQAAPDPGAPQAPPQYYSAPPGKSSTKTIWLIVGAVAILPAIAIVGIIAAIAIPNLLRARIAANESSAVSSLRTINTAEVSYATAYPNIGYSAALANLGPGGATCPAGGPTNAAACLIDNVLGNAAVAGKSGYVITETGGAANAQGIVVTYETEATPQAFNQSGVRGFCSIEDAVIRWEANGTNAMGAAGCPALLALQ